ncbi:MAG TPA: S53 family peptidase [Jatrophihabitans sp.]|jgi:subtilase family serine protease|nr:S53 family peptidase [Jatrophihabitans sp.]
MNKHALLRTGIALVASAVVVAGVTTAGTTASATPRPVTHRIHVQPQISKAVKGSAVHFGCQDRPIDGSAGPKCYQPAQIQTAYGLTPLLNNGKTGAGRTIVIVDAFQSPYVKSDLSIFNSTFGLPNASFQQIAPFGLTPFDPNDANMDGWAEEITLDVLWAHAMAPRAKIVLALARSNNDADILDTTKYVVDHNVGDVISQSFGEAETCMDPTLLAEQHQVFADATAKGITLFASSGDSGAAQFNCAGTGAILAASTPASDPFVTGVGGTTLNADGTTGAYIGETAWTEQLFGCNPPAVKKQDINCSGGGFSTIYSRPDFQSSIGGSGGRGVPDIAYNAGVNGGVLTHCGICNLLSGLDPLDPTTFFLFGGTSAGSPQWAGITAVGDQIAGRRLGDINAALYTVAGSANYSSALHDVTVGDNFVQEIHTGYNTAPKWDAVTGLGTPNASGLLPQLISLTG